MAKRKFQIYRGNGQSGELVDYEVEVQEGMVVLDVIHKIQAEQANDLAVMQDAGERCKRVLVPYTEVSSVTAGAQLCHHCRQ